MKQHQELKDYRFRAVLKTGKKGDHVISMDARKIAVKNNISKRGSLYRADLEQIRLEFGEDLMVEIWEVVMWMLPEKIVREAVREYFEN